MKPRTKRIALVAGGLTALAVAAGLILTAFQQNLVFFFTPSQIAAFRSGSGDVVVGFDHPNYGHMAVMPQAVRGVLAQDFA